jgi:N-acetylglucosamine-6-phosphate deacetylase
LADGRIVIAGQDQLLAGSTQSIDRCVGLCMQYAGVGLREAVDMASRNPARLMGLDYGTFQAGDEADFVVFRHDAPSGPLKVVATLAAGEVRYGAVPGVS